MPGVGFEPTTHTGFKPAASTSWATRAPARVVRGRPRRAQLPARYRVPGTGTRSESSAWKLRTSAYRGPPCAGRALTAPAPAGGRAAGRAHAPGSPGRLRSTGPALSAAPARLLPPHARLEGGRRGRAPGGVRGRLQRTSGRRPPDQRAAVALPDRP